MFKGPKVPRKIFKITSRGCWVKLVKIISPVTGVSLCYALFFWRQYYNWVFSYKVFYSNVWSVYFILRRLFFPCENKRLFFFVFDKKTPSTRKMSFSCFIISAVLLVRKLFPIERRWIASNTAVFPDPFSPQITLMPALNSISNFSWFLNDTIWILWIGIAGGFSENKHGGLCSFANKSQALVV